MDISHYLHTRIFILAGTVFGSYCNMCHIVIVNAVQLWRSIYIQFYRCHVSNFACIIILVLHLKLYFYHYFSFPIPLVEHGEKKGPIQNHHLQVASFSNFYNYMYSWFIISLITWTSCGNTKLFNSLVVIVYHPKRYYWHVCVGADYQSKLL